MEQELNIAAILRDKPNGTKLYSRISGDCILEEVNEESPFPINVSSTNTRDWCYLKDGKYVKDGEVCLFPSKAMQDWSKFDWEKGDILQISDIGFCTFEKWTSDDYTTFKGRYGVGLDKNNDHDYDVKKDLTTSMWYKVDNKDFIKEYISTVEERFGGKLNQSTLEIEKPQFKDGDVVAMDIQRSTDIAILKSIYTEDIVLYAVFCDGKDLLLDEPCKANNVTLRIATDSEKQQLFDALAKENKRWNAETKTLEDLPKKCEFKPKDWCLMRNVDEIEGKKVVTTEWTLCQFSHYLGDYKIVAVGGDWFGECIPYNDQTAHLIGTFDNYKEGGEK